MSTFTLNQFQEQVSDLLLRHRSILDVISKNQQSNSAVNRAVTKAITDCGCIQVNGSKQNFSNDMSMEELKDSLDTHLSGSLCESCKDTIRSELGRNLFYIASLCNLMDIDLEEVIRKESDTCSTLGLFHLS